MKNNEINFILNFMKNYSYRIFELESLSFFKKYLSNDLVDKNYFNTKIKFDENGRSYFKLNNVESLDKGWAIFQATFKNFINAYKITYKNFLENKILINKNFVKIERALKNFYNNPENEIYILQDIVVHSFSANFLDIYFKNEQINAFFNVDSIGQEEGRPNNFFIKITTPTLLKKIFIKANAPKRIGKIIKEINSFISSKLKDIFKLKLPKDDLYLVISFNRLDWFFSSTENSWTTCYEAKGGGYRDGLPQLLLEDCRCLIYITNKEQKIIQASRNDKENFIKLDKILYRTWTLKNINYPDQGIQIVKVYPNNIAIELVLNDILSEDKLIRGLFDDFTKNNNIIYFLIDNQFRSVVPFYDTNVITKAYSKNKKLNLHSMVYYIIKKIQFKKQLKKNIEDGNNDE